MIHNDLKNIHFIRYKDKYIAFFYELNEMMLINNLAKNVITSLYFEENDILTVVEKYNINEEDIVYLDKHFTTFVKTKRKNIEKIKTTKCKIPKAGVEYKINISHKCNLDCKYCYAEYNKDNTLMTNEIAEKTASYIIKNTKNCNALISFFGGEPLLNLDAIETICKILSKNQDVNNTNYEFAIITNLTILNDRIIDIFKKYSFTIRVSIDGEKKIHDKLRVYHNGKGSFDIVNANLKHLIGAIGIEKVGYEATYTKIHEQHGISRNELREYLENNYGFLQSLLVDVAHPKEFKPDSQFDAGIFEKKYNLVDDAFKLFLGKYLRKEKMYYVCGMGKTYFAISATGDIYPCQQFVGSNLCIGNIDKGVFNIDSIKQVDLLEKSKNPKCLNCWVKDLCSDCPAILMKEKNNIIYTDERCNIIRKSIEKQLSDICTLRKNQKTYNNFIHY